MYRDGQYKGVTTAKPSLSFTEKKIIVLHLHGFVYCDYILLVRPINTYKQLHSEKVVEKM